MPSLFTSTRSALALLGAAAAFSLVASPADAAARKAKPLKTRADLTVRQLNVDVSDTGSLLISGNLLNIGRKLARPSDLVIALSDDNVLDDNDEVLDEVSSLRLAPGARRAIDDEVDVPEDVDTSEELNILVCADGFDDLLERSETNNCVSQGVVVDDLAPADPSGDGSDPAADDGSDQPDSTDDGQ